jgi:Ca2+-binding EF-hand superfamily protein
MKFAKSAVLAAAAFALASGAALAADTQTNKSAASNVSRSDDSGFAKLDKNKDGYISKSEAKGEKTLSSNFAKWDMNNDGKINRAEYLAAMAKEDAVKAKDKVSSAFSKDKSSTSSTGSSTSTKSTTK